MRIPPFPESHLKQLADIIGNHLSHPEVSEILPRIGFTVPPKIKGPRWYRVQSALSEKQGRERCGNNILALVKEVVSPVRFIGRAEEQKEFVTSLNKVLSFSGYQVELDGTIRTSTPAKTVSEAQARADGLREKLRQRSVHPDVLSFCRAELLHYNYFHAVLEATKSVAEKIRQRTSLTCDGDDLVIAAFNIKTPLLALNTLRTESEQSEQKGFANLLRGMFGTFRNPTAHAPKVTWRVNEQDALDLLTLVSYLHRRIDDAACVPIQL